MLQVVKRRTCFGLSQNAAHQSLANDMLWARDLFHSEAMILPGSATFLLPTSSNFQRKKAAFSSKAKTQFRGVLEAINHPRPSTSFQPTLSLNMEVKLQSCASNNQASQSGIHTSLGAS